MSSSHFQESKQEEGAKGETQTNDDGTKEDGATKNPQTGSGTAQGGGSGKTSPPETIFKKLAPSHNRYTLLRDELQSVLFMKL